MLCKNCKHFKVQSEPYKYIGYHKEPGQAICDKYNLIVDFFSHKKFDDLTCGKGAGRMTDLWIRDKYSGTIHKIGDNPHDCLMVDEEGTVRYYNLQNGDGCKGYKSVNRQTLADKYPDKDWGKRAGEYTSGYEFVPNTDEYGIPYDPTKENQNE